MLDILKQLGTDQSIFYQFVVIIVVYAIAKFVFINHLQALLDTRDDKTLKLEGSTEKQFEEIEKIQTAYKEKIRVANKDLKGKLEAGKADIAKKYESEYRSSADEISNFIENSKKEIEADIKGKREKVLADAESLANNLVQKITKEL
jgi:F0F1-type ATP synthase membrane subunit b/b'